MTILALKSILLIWLILSSVLGIIFGALWFLDENREIVILWMPNHFAQQVSNDYDLNKAGHFFVDIICNIVFLPTVLIAMATIALIWIPMGLLMLFAWVFRKR